ncbi:potassium-transporting ATPase subunit KdpC [Oryzibacter oryziterrae]|uniref:potassium-transporting ATPase subunit KdpC n=1 Tax=Oryzibacter oryziterrae TaxID=2766474 RepID=UPI001F0051A1|nr:potassium-transporting ATPase subunit KdpC [Oryzibacter oryziterrae]
MTLTSQLRASAAALTLFTLLLGGAYPAITTIGLQTLSPAAAGGNLVTGGNGEIVGSRLLGQTFTAPRYLWGRPSATGSSPYDASASSGSNLGVNNPTLIDAVKARVAALKAADPGNTASVPVDLVTASASGLDPDISPAAADYQVGRIAKARGLDEAQVRTAIASATSGRTLGLFGDPRVNVLAANMALDKLGQ